MPVKKHGYSGDLDAPIIRPAPPTFEGAVTDKRVKDFNNRHKDHQREAKLYVAQERSRKMSLLAKHYNISNESELALALAVAHVPGFKVVPATKIKRGRKKEWDGPKLQALYDAVQRVRKLHSYNDRQAIKFISHNPEYAKDWGRPPIHKGSDKQWVETLESRLQDAKCYVAFVNSLPGLLEGIRAESPAKKFRKS